MANSTDFWGNISGEAASDVETILVPIFDSFILVTGVVGHSLVIVVLCRALCARSGRLNAGGMGGAQQTLVNGTDVFLLSLSVADLLFLAALPYHTIAIATRHWPFGSFMCKAVSFLGSTCASASAFTLATLAFSRYVTVVEPTKAYRWRRDGRFRLAALLLWVPAVVLATPQFAWRTVRSGSETRETRQDLACFNFLSEGGQLAYGVCHFLLAFALPLSIIVVAYGKIYLFLKRTRQGQAGQTDRLEQYQARVTQTSALLVLAFTLCWLPSYGLMFAQIEADISVTGPLPRYGAFATFARVMATSSTVVNPILYVFMSQKFRKELIELGRGSCKNWFT